MDLRTHNQLTDSLSLISSSIHFFNDSNNIDSLVKFELSADTLFIVNSENLVKGGIEKLDVQYRILPLYFGKSTRKLDSSLLKVKNRNQVISYDLIPAKNNLNHNGFLSDQLDYNGSFARGLSFGNSQSLVLNSTFNLQLAGRLSNDIEILAAISDANIPIQPEGTTQQLQDFDRVFIQLKRKETTLIAGDYELTKPNSYFINYFKKLQGISVNHSHVLNNSAQLTQKGSAAISRGKFSRNFITVTEGNQGPYKLVGKDGERFIIALSGTERVFLDGRLLTRGEENDYVIFYDRAEIVFTTNLLITKDSRIIVEFEYADQRYQRSLYQYETSYHKDRFSMDFSMISQQDSRNVTGNLSLDSLDRILLNNSGDQDALAIRSGIIRDVEEFSNNRIYYKQSYDPITQDSFLVFTSNPDSALFRATFTDVGPGLGSYNISEQINANGRVYAYVGPGNGNYDPITRLSAPEQTQMYAFNTEYRLKNEGSIRMELAMSYFDLNRISKRDDEDNLGFSGRLDFQEKFRVGKHANWSFIPQVGIEVKERNFQFFNPYRAPEFTRDWNINPEIQTNEILSDLGFSLMHNKGISALEYRFNNFTQFQNYQGNKHFIRGMYNNAGWNMIYQNNYLNAHTDSLESQFSRPKLTIEKTFDKLGGWTLGWYGEREKNSVTLPGQDSLSVNSFYYDYTKTYIRKKTSDHFQMGLGFNQRTDYSPIPGSFTKNTTAREYEFNGQWSVNSLSTANWNFIYRSLKINDAELSDQKENATLLGNFNHFLRLWNGGLNSTINLKLASGQEPKIEFDFREVLPGEGDYVWIDNGDGIQERNEFQIAPFKDQANFLRVSLFNNEFIRTNNRSFTQSLRIDPNLIFRKLELQRKWMNALSKFSLVSNFRLDNKTQGSNSFFSLNNVSIPDSNLVSFNSLYNGILYFNRGNSQYDAQIGARNNTNKIAQTVGSEERSLREYYFRNRIALFSELDLILNFKTGRKSLSSQFFKNNDFDLVFNAFESQFSYRKGNAYRLTIDYSLEKRANILNEGNENAIINDLNLDFAYSLARTSRINLNVRYASVEYNGSVNSVLELNMLDGLKNGNNFLWNIDFSRRIMGNVDISMRYEGRKTGNSRIIHLGRVQLKSSF